MAAAQKDPVLVVVQLTGGNDYLNTVIPYNNSLYQDNRKAVGIPESQILAIDNEYGFPQYLAPMKKILGRGQARDYAWRRLSRFAALAFPLDGHLAYLRGGEGWD